MERKNKRKVFSNLEIIKMAQEGKLKEKEMLLFIDLDDSNNTRRVLWLDGEFVVASGDSIYEYETLSSDWLINTKVEIIEVDDPEIKELADKFMEEFIDGLIEFFGGSRRR